MGSVHTSVPRGRRYAWITTSARLPTSIDPTRSAMPCPRPPKSSGSLFQSHYPATFDLSDLPCSLRIATRPRLFLTRGRSLGSTSTVWAGAGRLSWRHSTPTIPSTTALSQFERPPPRQAGSPLRFRRRGGTLCRRRSAGACRFEVSPANWPSIGTRRRNTCRLRVRQ